MTYQEVLQQARGNMGKNSRNPIVYNYFIVSYFLQKDNGEKG